MTPIHPHLMSSVSLDVFFPEAVTWESQTYDALVLCVDRHSGWTLAMPTQRQGLTAEKVARYMLEKWEAFSIPSMVTSDQGPQFVGA